MILSILNLSPLLNDAIVIKRRKTSRKARAAYCTSAIIFRFHIFTFKSIMPYWWSKLIQIFAFKPLVFVKWRWKQILPNCSRIFQITLYRIWCTHTWYLISLSIGAGPESITKEVVVNRLQLVQYLKNSSCVRYITRFRIAIWRVHWPELPWCYSQGKSWAIFLKKKKISLVATCFIINYNVWTSSTKQYIFIRWSSVFSMWSLYNALYITGECIERGISRRRHFTYTRAIFTKKAPNREWHVIIFHLW